MRWVTWMWDVEICYGVVGVVGWDAGGSGYLSLTMKRSGEISTLPMRWTASAAGGDYRKSSFRIQDEAAYVTIRRLGVL